MKRFRALSPMFFVLLAITSFAQTTIRVAADSSSGTYNKMLGEIIGVCNDDSLNIVPANQGGGGAIGNLDALVNNKADAAFLHSDVICTTPSPTPAITSSRPWWPGGPNPFTSWRFASPFPKSMAHSRSARRSSPACPTSTVTP